MASERTSTYDNGVYDGIDNVISNINFPLNEGNQSYDNEVYANENDIVNQNIQTTIAGSWITQPPKYEETWKQPVISGVPPPKYFQPQLPSFLTSEVIQSPFPHQQAQMQQPHFVGNDNTRLKFKKLNKIFGVISLVFGCILMILDPLIPSIFQYYYSMFPAGLFMLISGICSVHASKKDNKCSLKASLTFDVFALILLFVGYVMGIIAAGNPRLSAMQCIYTQCLPSINFYINGIQGFAIFHTVFGIILFVLMLWDSTLKCRTLCCKK